MIIFFHMNSDIFTFFVAICDLVHDVETIYNSPLLTAKSIWRSFLKYDFLQVSV